MLQSRDAGQYEALDELEGGATAGREMADPVADADPVDGGQRVAAADHAAGRGIRHRTGDALGALRKRRDLEHAHRSVPEDGPRLLVPDARRPLPSPDRCPRRSSPAVSRTTRVAAPG